MPELMGSSTTGRGDHLRGVVGRRARRRLRGVTTAVAWVVDITRRALRTGLHKVAGALHHQPYIWHTARTARRSMATTQECTVLEERGRSLAGRSRAHTGAVTDRRRCTSRGVLTRKGGQVGEHRHRLLAGREEPAQQQVREEAGMVPDPVQDKGIRRRRVQLRGASSQDGSAAITLAIRAGLLRAFSSARTRKTKNPPCICPRGSTQHYWPVPSQRDWPSHTHLEIHPRPPALPPPLSYGPPLPVRVSASRPSSAAPRISAFLPQ